MCYIKIDVSIILLSKLIDHLLTVTFICFLQSPLFVSTVYTLYFGAEFEMECDVSACFYRS